jgi:hypothetical protein
LIAICLQSGAPWKYLVDAAVPPAALWGFSELAKPYSPGLATSLLFIALAVVFGWSIGLMYELCYDTAISWACIYGSSGAGDRAWLQQLPMRDWNAGSSLCTLLLVWALYFKSVPVM